MNKLRNDLLFGAVMYVLISVYPIHSGTSQPIPEANTESDQVDTPVTKPLIDTDIVQKAYENLSELKSESKAGKELSKSIQKESKKSRKTKIIVKSTDTSSIEGRVLYNEYSEKDSVLTTSDSTFIKLTKEKEEANTTEKKFFLFRWFSRNKNK